MTGILDYGAGNLFSVENAMTYLGKASRRLESPEELARVDRLIFPGVGHFGAMMMALRRRHLDEGLRQFVESGKPMLGICLGMQAFFEGSDEAPEATGFGWLAGRATRFESGVKTPHMGWAETQFPDGRMWAYFAHSFRVAASEHAWGVAEHGGAFVAAIKRENLTGVQFHPEKSGPEGLEFLRRWLES